MLSDSLEMSINPERIQAVVKHKINTINVLWKESCESTNRDLMKLAEEGAPNWTVLIADSQVKGRGRHERSWMSPSGGLYMSILLRLGKSDSPVTLLPLTAGLSVYRAILDESIQRGGQVDPRLKWPNDVLTENGKLAGILCESFERDGEWTVICGIGVNMSPLAAEVRRLIQIEVTSLLEESQLPWTKSGLVVAILRCLFEDLENWRFAPEEIRERWLIASGMKGKTITVTYAGKEFHGTVEGLSEPGGLLLKGEDGISEINSAEGIVEHHAKQ